MAYVRGLLREVPGEAGVRRRGGRDGQRPAFGQGQVPGLRHRHEPDPGQERLSRATASAGVDGPPTPGRQAGRRAGRARAVEYGPLPEPPLADHQALQAEALHQGREHHRPDGQQGRPTGLDARQGHPGVEVQRGQAVGELVELAGGDLHLVDPSDEDDPGCGGRWSPMARRASARTVPPLAMTRSGGIGWRRSMSPIGPDRSAGEFRDGRPLGAVSRSPVSSSPRIRAVPRATLATAPTASTVPMPASRLPPPRSSPRTGWSPTHTPARWPRKHRRASSSPESRVIGLPSIRSSRPAAGCRCRRRGGRRWPTPPPRRPRRPRPRPCSRFTVRTARPAVAWNTAGAGHLGPEVEERAPTEHRARADRHARRRPPSGGRSCCPGRKRLRGRWASAGRYPDRRVGRGTPVAMAYAGGSPDGGRPIGTSGRGAAW